MADSVSELQNTLRGFAAERDWAQFHTPKNLAMALVAEVGELVEHFQWLTPQQAFDVASDPSKVDAVADELADVLIYLVRLADVLSVDLIAAAASKIADNAKRYPADQVRGSAEKAPPRRS